MRHILIVEDNSEAANRAAKACGGGIGFAQSDGQGGFVDIRTDAQGGTIHVDEHVVGALRAVNNQMQG